METYRQWAKSLHKKINLISEEISGKENEIQGLRKSNAILIEANLDKTRKPSSLETQRKQITRLDLELLELALVKKSLKEKLTLADSNIKKERLREQITAFEAEAARQLQLFERFQESIDTTDNLILEIEEYSGRNHCLSFLLRLLSENSNLVSQEVDLEKILGVWSRPIRLLLSLNFDNAQRRAADTGQGINGLWMQLNALCSGSRTFPTPSKTKLATPHLPDKHQLRAMQAGQEAKENRERKHNSTMRFVHQAPAPPG